MNDIETLKSVIRDIPDFPKEGIVFKDITPLLANADALKKTIDIFKDRYAGKGITVVVGIEARGFIFASALAYVLGAGMVLVRKPGKLPHKIFRQAYTLEYGTDAVEIHQDAFQPGQKIVILDDVLATGGTVAATTNLIRNNFQAEIVEVAFLIELDFLKGRGKIHDLPVFSLMHF